MTQHPPHPRPLTPEERRTLTALTGVALTKPPITARPVQR